MFSANYLWPNTNRAIWQWQPTLTVHDPNPPITLENSTLPDDPETRSVAEVTAWQPEDDAFRQFLDLVIEDGVVTSDAELLALADALWHGVDEVEEPLAEQYIEDAVEFLLDALPEIEIEEEGFDYWLEQVIEDVADPETRFAIEDLWHGFDEEHHALELLEQPFDVVDDIGTRPPPFEEAWQPEEESADYWSAESVVFYLEISEWIIRARRRARK